MNPVFFSPWEKHRTKNYILYIYIQSKTNLRIDTPWRIHWESTLDSEDPVSSRPIMYVGDFSTGSPAISCREMLESERSFKSRLQNVAKRRPNGMDTKWDYFRWICRMLNEWIKCWRNLCIGDAVVFVETMFVDPYIASNSIQLVSSSHQATFPWRNFAANIQANGGHKKALREMIAPS